MWFDMENEDQKQLGLKIRELRKKKNLTMQQLAMVDVNYTTIYRVETGKVSPSVVFCRILPIIWAALLPALSRKREPS